MPTAISKAEAAKRRAQSEKDKAQSSKKLQPLRVVMPPKMAAAPKMSRRASHPYVEQVIDPFNVSGEGLVGLPDMFNAPTQVLKLRDTLTLTTNASGIACFVIKPALVNFRTSGAFTGTAFTSWGSGTNHEKNALVVAECPRYRIIGQGVRVTYMGAPSVATGRVCVLPMVGIANTDLSTTTDDWYDAPNAIECTPSELPVEYHMSPFDNPTFQASASADFTSSFPGVAILFSGAVVSALLLSVEVVTYVEMVPYTTTLNAHSSKPTPSHPTALAAAANATSMGPHLVSDETKVMANRRQIVDSTFAALGVVGESLGVPYSSLIGNIPGAFRRVRKTVKGIMN